MDEQTQVLQAALQGFSQNPDLFVQALNVLSSSEEGQKILNALVQNKEAGMFKDGGKMAKLAQFGTKVNKSTKGTDGNLIVKKKRNGNYNITSRDKYAGPGEKKYKTERNIPADKVTPEAKKIAESNNWKKLGKKH